MPGRRRRRSRCGAFACATGARGVVGTRGVRSVRGVRGARGGCTTAWRARGAWHCVARAGCMARAGCVPRAGRLPRVGCMARAGLRCARRLRGAWRAGGACHCVARAGCVAQLPSARWQWCSWNAPALMHPAEEKPEAGHAPWSYLSVASCSRMVVRSMAAEGEEPSGSSAAS